MKFLILLKIIKYKKYFNVVENKSIKIEKMNN